ncbi:Sphingomyelin phosphodiesterase [Entamoeba marina]
MSDSSTVKILLIGESGVGKTALLQRYCDNKFTEEIISTIGVDYRSKRIDVKGQQITLQLWDTAGQERFRNITTSYYRGSQGVLIVYDVNDYESLTKVTYWINELKKEGVDGVVFLVGNKMDCCDSGLSKKQEEILKSTKLPEYRVSAKTGDGVFELFDQFVDAIHVGEMEEVVYVKPENSSETKNGCC